MTLRQGTKHEGIVWRDYMLDLRKKFDPVDLHAYGKRSGGGPVEPPVQAMLPEVELLWSQNRQLII